MVVVVGGDEAFSFAIASRHIGTRVPVRVHLRNRHRRSFIFFVTMVALQVDHDDFKSIPKKRFSNKKRVVIGNLPANSPDLTTQLTDLFQSIGISISEKDVLIAESSSPSSACTALVDCEYKDVEAVIQKLHRHQFAGSRLVVQREKSLKGTTTTKPKQPTTFAPNSWSKPKIKETATAAATTVVAVVKDELPNLDTFGSLPHEDLVEGDPAHLSQQPLSALLADYGAQDVDWKKSVTVEPVNATHSTPSHEHSVLGQHGKAPIHITVMSFGYRHGAPPNIGSTYAQPLNPFDVRHFEPVPHYMAWQHGLSTTVKYALLRQDQEGAYRKTTTEIASNAATALETAIQEGGHGYALPLNMMIFIGSDNGQHRSVMLGEQVAMGLRRHLRENIDCRFGTSVKVSVGTKHRDMERKTSASTAKPKQKDMEDEW
jgi:hypothetical protein